MNVFVKKEKPALCAQCLVLSQVLRQIVWIFQCAPRNNRVEMSLSVA